MSGISSIANSLTSSLLSSLLSGSTTSANAQSSGAVSDIVSLLGGSSSNSDESLYNIFSGSQGPDPTDPMYSILLSAESASIIQANPSMVQQILSADQTSAGSSASSGAAASQTTSTQALVQELENMNLLTIAPDTLMSMLQNDIASQGSAVQAASSQVNQTA